MTPPALLHICLSQGWGGLEMYPIRTGKGMLGRGWRVFGLALRGSQVAAGMREAGIEVLEVGSRAEALLRLPLLLRWLRQREIGVVHCHKSGDLLLAALLKSWHPLRLIFTEHMGVRRPKRDWLHRWIYGKVDLVLSISDETLRRNRIALPLPAERFRRLWLGTELQGCSEPAAAIRRELGLPDGPLIGMVGRFSRAKGQGELLKAFILLLARYPTAQLLLVGGKLATEGANEPFVAELQGFIDEHQLAERVHLTGFRRDTRRLLQAMDVVVIPSHNEAFGLTVIEAMAAGKPIVGADSGAIPEVLGEAGLLANVFDPAALAQQIMRVLNDPELAASLQTQARLRAEQEFGLAAHLMRLERCYLDPCDPHPF